MVIYLLGIGSPGTKLLHEHLEVGGEGAVDDEVGGGVEENQDVRDGFHAHQLDRWCVVQVGRDTAATMEGWFDGRKIS